MLITETFEVDGEVIEEKTYPVVDRVNLDSMKATFALAPIHENAELVVRFSFDPPLEVPQ